jgi:hypothetical protein
MFRRPAVPALLVLFGLYAVPAPAAAAGGWLVQLVHADRDTEGTAELHIQGDRFRVSESGNAQEAIVGPEAVTVVNRPQRSYTVVTYAQMEATFGMMTKMVKGVQETQRKALEDAMKSLPPDQQTQIQKQLDAMGGSGDSPAPEVTVAATGEKATIAGLSARKSVVSLDGKPSLEIWLTSEIPVAPLKSVLTRLGKIAPGQAGIQARYVEALEGVDGFPLKVVDLDPKQGGTVMTVTRASPRDFPASEFEPPEGFEKTEFSLGPPGK